MITIKNYGQISLQTAQDIATMVDIHDRPGQSARFQSVLRKEIVTALGVTDTRAALNVARTAASVLTKMRIRERPDWIRRGRRFQPMKAEHLAGAVPDGHRKPRASAA